MFLPSVCSCHLIYCKNFVIDLSNGIKRHSTSDYQIGCSKDYVQLSPNLSLFLVWILQLTPLLHATISEETLLTVHEIKQIDVYRDLTWRRPHKSLIHIRIESWSESQMLCPITELPGWRFQPPAPSLWNVFIPLRGCFKKKRGERY